MNLVFGYDTETTGLPAWKKPSEDKCQPHLVQLAGILADADTQKELCALDLIIKPNGWTIPDEVAEIHGITTEMAHDVGIDETLAVQTMLQLQQGATRIAHNRTFDQRIIRIALKRYEFPEETIEAWANKDNHVCTMLIAKPIMQLPPRGKYGFKPPKLEEAYKHFTGKDLENAHTAMADARACLETYFSIVNTKEKEAC